MEKIREYLKRGETKKASAEETVNDLLKLLEFDPRHYAIFDIWDREAASLARGCRAVAMQGSRLCVQVPSVVHRHELFYSKDRILNRVNQAMGRRVITDVQVELEKD